MSDGWDLGSAKDSMADAVKRAMKKQFGANVGASDPFNGGGNSPSNDMMQQLNQLLSQQAGQGSGGTPIQAGPNQGGALPGSISVGPGGLQITQAPLMGTPQPMPAPSAPIRSDQFMGKIRVVVENEQDAKLTMAALEELKKAYADSDVRDELDNSGYITYAPEIEKIAVSAVAIESERIGLDPSLLRELGKLHRQRYDAATAQGQQGVADKAVGAMQAIKQVLDMLESSMPKQDTDAVPQA